MSTEKSHVQTDAQTDRQTDRIFFFARSDIQNMNIHQKERIFFFHSCNYNTFSFNILCMWWENKNIGQIFALIFVLRIRNDEFFDIFRNPDRETMLFTTVRVLLSAFANLIASNSGVSNSSAKSARTLQTQARSLPQFGLSSIHGVTKWLAQIFNVLSLRITTLTVCLVLCLNNLTSPVPRSFHSAGLLDES